MSEHLGPNSFWNFSLEVWAQDPVRELLLHYQDKNQLDINLCLFALWSASQGKLIGQSHDLETIQSLWHDQFVAPIRRLRRLASCEKSSPLRKALFDAELEAEKAYQLALGQLGETLTRSELDTASILTTNLENLFTGLLSEKERGVLLEIIN